uniref:ATP synthase F0 subunit 6 n=1 Tax=Sapajus apella macrocephalus TaxID=1547595 RepID=UPI0020373398|nr:ATP synthase F0 subunit 6 [Sapajus apella macrocephalus]YP_010409900.1 ATP synthase F0 subunit 6 [Sapajus apella]URH14421.1 ATP synthase F0 subunit 6 [Sapajus apella macrocephalus]URH15045.1 ATP synthase F0 subunit 6 [Sapajus apella]URH15058.1 ATP synthase F0 subunit 6 [Sapajus apella]URH15071.1 ATP synthase F0 subunit 6 [Sapajus apella macrocephalus]URH15084.1 ATP synthase F0 subunit 6 [Sapajus apella macrocephalus]
MNQNLFASFNMPMILGVPLATLFILFPTMLITPSNNLNNNRFSSLQQWLIQLMLKQMMMNHTTKGQAWSLMLLTLITFITLNNLLGIMPYTFTPTTQLSMNLGMAIPLWMATVLTGLRFKTKATLAHFLPQGTPTLLIPMLIIIETISLFIQPMALAVRLTANITAGHLLMHLLGDTTLTLLSIYLSSSVITIIVIILLITLELGVALIQAYVFTLLVSLYLHNNS